MQFYFCTNERVLQWMREFDKNMWFNEWIKNKSIQWKIRGNVFDERFKKIELQSIWKVVWVIDVKWRQWICALFHCLGVELDGMIWKCCGIYFECEWIVFNFKRQNVTRHVIMMISCGIFMQNLTTLKLALF